jgi:hypothetical protein
VGHGEGCDQAHPLPVLVGVPFVGQSINDLTRRADKQDCRIVSWSTYEMIKIAERELSPSLLRMFEPN